MGPPPCVKLCCRCVHSETNPDSHPTRIPTHSTPLGELRSILIRSADRFDASFTHLRIHITGFLSRRSSLALEQRVDLSPREVAAVVRAPLACWFSPQLYERGLSNEVALMFKRTNSRPRQVFDVLANSGLAPRQMIMPAVSLAASGKAFAAPAMNRNSSAPFTCWGITFQMM